MSPTPPAQHGDGPPRRAEAVLDLGGQTALVTGAGQGVGAEIAHVLAAQGAHVLVNDFRAERAAAVAREIADAGHRATALPFDVTDFTVVMAAVADARARLGAVDILVNNAGNAGAGKALADFRPFWETGPEEWQHWLGVNLFGVMNCSRAVLDGMRARGHGRIITISSDAGRTGEGHLAVYSCAKAGAAGLMRALAKAGGRFGITANCIALGGIDTPSARDVLVDDAAMKKMLAHYVIRRIGTPSDAAWMTLFLASRAASWITGQTYPVNGGYSFAL